MLEGIILKDATVRAKDGTIYQLPVRGMDKDGYHKVLINATEVGGRGIFSAQSIYPYIGLKVEFEIVEKGYNGYNFKIIKSRK